ncbi:MAG: hypothetical protein WCT32_00420 [Patescibacteria group bacterium]|jgi:hypothetical protein
MPIRQVPYKGKPVDYEMSTSEQLLEKICRGLGTDLLSAEIGGDTRGSIFLVRRSRPTLITGQWGEKFMLQFQLTRFSADYSRRFLDVYCRNMGQPDLAKTDPNRAEKYVRDERGRRPVVDSVTRSDFYRTAILHRWPKAIYCAIYPVTEAENTLELVQPASIYDPGISWHGRLAVHHLTLMIEPVFVLGNVAEPRSELSDLLTIRLPEKERVMSMAFRQATESYPIDRLSDLEKPFLTDPNSFCVSYRINAAVPRAMSMGFFQSIAEGFVENL